MLKNRHDHSKYKTLKLAVSQELMDGMIWFFVVVTNSGEVKNYFNSFCEEVIRIGRGYLGQRILRIAVSQEWNDELSWFLLANSNGIIFRLDRVSYSVSLFFKNRGSITRALFCLFNTPSNKPGIIL